MMLVALPVSSLTGAALKSVREGRDNPRSTYSIPCALASDPVSCDKRKKLQSRLCKKIFYNEVIVSYADKGKYFLLQKGKKP
jgi:hypothetical protein